MSGKWSAEQDDDGIMLWWASGRLDPTAWGLTADDLALDEVGFGVKAEEAFAALVADVKAAARLRSLAALFDQPLNRDSTFTFTGHALAEMLRGEG